MKYTKNKKVKSPEYGTSGSVGIDFFVPEDTDEFRSQLLNKNQRNNISSIKDFSDVGFIVNPHEAIVIPSGIHVLLDKNVCLIAFNKSGVCTKKGLIAGACVVDPDYQGEVHLHLINTTNEEVLISFGEKILQFILVPIAVDSSLDEILNTADLYYNTKSERGENRFGSTDEKSK